MGRRGGAVLLAACAVAVAVSGCAAGGGDPDPARELMGWGTVIESSAGSGEGLLCLSGVGESAPPQCVGEPVSLRGFDWASAPEALESGGVRWFDGTVHGTWDGSALTLTRPVAVGDQTGLPPADPSELLPGTADEQTIERVMDEVDARAEVDARWLSAFSFDDHVIVVVVVDDGALQAELDDEFGEGVAVVRSALRPA